MEEMTKEEFKTRENLKRLRERKRDVKMDLKRLNECIEVLETALEEDN